MDKKIHRERQPSICVHSDTPNAVEVARAVRDALTSCHRASSNEASG